MAEQLRENLETPKESFYRQEMLAFRESFHKPVIYASWNWEQTVSDAIHHAGFKDFAEQAKARITSYNVCYTKLLRITECRYGVDLVEEQIAVAFGSKLRFNERNTKPRQCAIQVRINCEDPRKNFAPNSGLITRYVSPGGQGIRLDSCISMGYEFPSQYDSAASLLIAYGNTWQKVCATLERGLREYIIGGVKTTIPFHRNNFV